MVQHILCHQAAIAAFKKDLMNNPELAAQYGVQMKPDTGRRKAEVQTLA